MYFQTESKNQMEVTGDHDPLHFAERIVTAGYLKHLQLKHIGNY